MTEQSRIDDTEVRNNYVRGRFHGPNTDPHGHFDGWERFGQEFERWLAGHDREIAEKAWYEGASHAAGDACVFARSGTSCPQNPYRVESLG